VAIFLALCLNNIVKPIKFIYPIFVYMGVLSAFIFCVHPHLRQLYLNLNGSKEFLEVLFTCLDKYIAFITIVEALANFAIFFVFYNNVKNLIWKEVKLSCGTFKIRQKYFTVQNVTNVVSLKFYNGGTVPDVRVTPTANNTKGSVRCIYDEWFWGTQPEARANNGYPGGYEFTWGDEEITW
jgi:hypothetical protein